MRTDPLTVDRFRSCLLQALNCKGSTVPDVVVGFSGGLDSTVLLSLCRELREQGVLKGVGALHVHHGLSRLADDWVNHAEALCQSWEIPLQVHYVQCGQGQNIEESARNARYQVFEESLQVGEVLLQAHHQDDQVETLLYRLVRGSGIHGMSGMPTTRSLGVGQLCRPLLVFPRSALEDYARRHGLEWIEDDSNTDTRFDRNFLRADIVPVLEQRWPGMKSRVARFSEICQDSVQLLDELAKEDLQAASLSVTFPGVGELQVVDCGWLSEQTAARRNLVLRHWLSVLDLPVPDSEMLERIYNEVVLARVDAEPELHWGGCSVYRHRHWLVALAALPRLGECKSQSSAVLKGDDFCLSFAGNGDVIAQWYDSSTGVSALRATTLNGQWSLRRDVMVEPFALPGRKGRKTLKKWLNELGVPAWLRERLPVLHKGAEVVAIPGVLVAADFCAGEGPGWSLKWQL
ncbi:tRNA lysidine(34) synthetase TilS [Parendozoicomonas haliclonae]|uniref:tRNA(Ile)-lysidine synthase n=1 Tax=Parendozoicomonas haliclonae TaxID=1960125 RepID=A0A1X7AH94_9GAMM|nr:tRNA lysidine(34) synthetase TilS [Parendozoicomonas haliclonae]SMA42176.1 tRNA(Ile)-lysidine synthase [Parendozoicomonas haliclonae]